MTPTLAEEIVEKAAKEIGDYNLCSDPDCLPCGALRRKVATAALLAVLPDVIEMCCKTIRKEAEAHLGDIVEGDAEGAKLVKHAVGCLLTVEEDVRALAIDLHKAWEKEKK